MIKKILLLFFIIFLITKTSFSTEKKEEIKKFSGTASLVVETINDDFAKKLHQMMLIYKFYNFQNLHIVQSQLNVHIKVHNLIEESKNNIYSAHNEEEKKVVDLIKKHKVLYFDVPLRYFLNLNNRLKGPGDTIIFSCPVDLNNNWHNTNYSLRLDQSFSKLNEMLIEQIKYENKKFLDDDECKIL